MALKILITNTLFQAAAGLSFIAYKADDEYATCIFGGYDTVVNFLLSLKNVKK